MFDATQEKYNPSLPRLMDTLHDVFNLSSRFNDADYTSLGFKSTGIRHGREILHNPKTKIDVEKSVRGYNDLTIKIGDEKLTLSKPTYTEDNRGIQIRFTYVNTDTQVQKIATITYNNGYSIQTDFKMASIEGRRRILSDFEAIKDSKILTEEAQLFCNKVLNLTSRVLYSVTIGTHAGKFPSKW